MRAPPNRNTKAIWTDQGIHASVPGDEEGNEDKNSSEERDPNCGLVEHTAKSVMVGRAHVNLYEGMHPAGARRPRTRRILLAVQTWHGMCRLPSHVHSSKLGPGRVPSSSEVK